MRMVQHTEPDLDKPPWFVRVCFLAHPKKSTVLLGALTESLGLRVNLPHFPEGSDWRLFPHAYERTLPIPTTWVREIRRLSKLLSGQNQLFSAS